MRRTLLLASFALFTSFSQPARAQFCPGAAPWVFDDVPAGDLFCTYITWAAQNGITQGCLIIDANHRLYCPNDAVTRSQMAAFVNRLGNVRVEAVGTGPGLTGGPITGIGTINLAATNLLPTVACANNQIARWNGSAWACSTDANSGGTVTSVGSGTGLSGGPITTSGSLSIAAGYQLPQSCTNGQVPKSNGAGGWTCQNDNDTNSGGTVTSLTSGTGITLTPSPITTTGSIAVNTTTIQQRVTGSCAVGSSIRVINNDGTVTCQTDNAGPANAFVQGGNAFGATATLGTTDGRTLVLVANGSEVMRYEGVYLSPNLIGGSPANSVTPGVRGATIAGGGAETGTEFMLAGAGPNRVTDLYGTVGGGIGNVAGDDAVDPGNRLVATVGGGWYNTASGYASTVGGGIKNTASGYASTVSGGGGFSPENDCYDPPSDTYTRSCGNQALATYATVGGGAANIASDKDSTVGGGEYNTASAFASTVGGGEFNIASGVDSTVPGGRKNVAQGYYSFAAGVRAKALHDRSFVWGGSNNNDTASFAAGEFVVYAPGGLRLYGTAGGCTLTDGSSGWACSSDRALKSEIAPVDTGTMLERVVALPVSRWSFTSVPGVMHVGPMAQDFHAAFGLGNDDRMVAPMDVQGVALAAIQGLNAKLEAAIVERDARIDAQAREIAELKRAVDVLLARTSPDGRIAAK